MLLSWGGEIISIYDLVKVLDWSLIKIELLFLVFFFLLLFLVTFFIESFQRIWSLIVFIRIGSLKLHQLVIIVKTVSTGRLRHCSELVMFGCTQLHFITIRD